MLCINLRNRTKESGVLVDGGNRQESGFHLASVTATPQRKKRITSETHDTDVAAAAAAAEAGSCRLF